MPTAAEISARALDDHGIGGIAAQIHSWITRARWFDRRGTDVAIELADIAVIRDRDPLVLLTLWQVHSPGEDGDGGLYSVLLGARPLPSHISEYGPDHLIGETNGVVVYDALADPEAAAELWWMFQEQRTVSTAHGRMVAHTDVAVEADHLEEVHLLGAEQSNTSLVRGHIDYLKWMRRLQPGPSVELEMSGVLHQLHFTHTPDRHGHIAYHRGDGEPAALALLQQHLHNGTEGWTLALTSLRDLYADAEEFESLSETDRQEVVENQGSSFVGEAGRLGEVTAELHIALADPSLGGAMQARPIDSATLQVWAAAMTSDLDSLLASGHPLLAPLAEQREVITAHFDALRHASSGGLAIRIHGDYHLGQVLRTDEGWEILDFEGEPDRTVAERRQPSSPLRDVAGMLRSFDYAAAAGLAERMSTKDPRWPALYSTGDAWASANRQAFWVAYLQRCDGVGLLPDAYSALVLRRAFEVQKAVYEVGYELGHRPDWLGIPLHFLLAGS